MKRRKSRKRKNWDRLCDICGEYDGKRAVFSIQSKFTNIGETFKPHQIQVRTKADICFDCYLMFESVEEEQDVTLFTDYNEAKKYLIDNFTKKDRRLETVFLLNMKAYKKYLKESIKNYDKTG